MTVQETEHLLRSYAVRETPVLIPHSSIPLYYQLYRLLKRFIEIAPLRAGDRFPSEELISSSFGVSRPTANRAVQVLVDQKWLARQRGRGAFVQDQSFVGLALLSENLSLAQQFPPDAQLKTTSISHEMISGNPQVSEILRLPVSEYLLYMRRLREVDGLPVMVCDSYLPADRFQDLKKTSIVRGSLYATLEEVYGYIVERSERKIVAQELVDRRVAALLAVPLFSPIMFFTGLTYAVGEEVPIEYMRAYVRECVAFTNTVHRNPDDPPSRRSPKEDQVRPQ